MPVVVAFCSQKGGVGKSTLARALAAVAAHAGLNVLLADLDPQQRTLMQWQKARTANKVSPLITVADFSNVSDVILAGEKRDLVVVDTPGGANQSTLEIARHAHLIVQPTGPSVDDLYPSVLLFHELKEAGIPRARLVAAICRVLEEDEEKAARLYLIEAGYEVLPGSIPEAGAFRIAQNRGQALTEAREKSISSRADDLIERLLIKVADAAAPAVAEISKPKKGDAA